MTAPVWIRGILSDEYGVPVTGASYFSGGEFLAQSGAFDPQRLDLGRLLALRQPQPGQQHSAQPPHAPIPHRQQRADCERQDVLGFIDENSKIVYHLIYIIWPFDNRDFVATVKYSNETHDFPGDVEANRLLSEALREPWRL